MSEFATLHYGDNQYSLPILSSTDGQEKVLDVQELYAKSGLYAYDPSLNNVAVAKSSITYIEPTKGKLYYRGYDVEELVAHSSFAEVSYLLVNGQLPSPVEYDSYSLNLRSHSLIHEAMRNFFDGFPGNVHPLAILATMVTALSSYYSATYEEHIHKGIDIKVRLLAKIRTLAAWAYKKSIGHPIVYPRDELSYCTNFLNMMFAVPAEPYTVLPEHDRLLNQLLILYSDHEQNVATSTVRLVGSTQANLFVCVNAGISALWGAREAAWSLHTMSMLNAMISQNMQPEQFFAKFIKGQEPMRSSAFGHKKYKQMGARAKVSQKLFHDYIKSHPEVTNDMIIEKALEVEKFVFGHPYFTERQLLPNLDFYSALLFRIMGIPENMFNVVRVIGKLSGWLAHWDEQRKSMTVPRSMRPQQLYCGPSPRPYVSESKDA